MWIECVKNENVILMEPKRLKDLPVTCHNKLAETSEFSAWCEFYRRCVSYSLVDSSVAELDSVTLCHPEGATATEGSTRSV